MTTRTREGLALAGGALAFGVAAEVLSRTVPGRLDVALGLSALVLIAGFLVQRGLVPAAADIAPLGPPFALLTVALIWRDSPTLFGLNLLGILVLAALASPLVRAVRWSRAGITQYPLGAVQVAGGSAIGAVPLVFSEIDWQSLPDGGPVHRLRGALVGLAVATPLAAVFGGLLMDADPAFERLMNLTLAPGLDDLTSHGVAVLAWSWIAAGALRLFLRREAQPATAGLARPGRVGLMEIGVVLGVLDLLFLAFVAVQFRYLFGGDELVRGATGLGYSEYARQGFFQLVTVAALSLPVLLLADWSFGRRDAATLLRFRLLASVMLVLLNVMLASALWRMRLYTAEYGLTELRFYTTAFMGWLVLVFGWFAATVLRERRERFGAGALAAGFLVLTALNLANPDALIARTNMARADTGRSVDAAYLAALSADALPTIRRLLPRLPVGDRCHVEWSLEQRWRGELDAPGRWTIALAALERKMRSPAGVSVGASCGSVVNVGVVDPR